MVFIRFIIFTLLLNGLVSFCTLFNFKTAFGQPERLKTIVYESDAYNIAAAAIRENIVTHNVDLSAADKIAGGNLLETLNEKVGPDGLQIMAEDFIDQMYDPENSGTKQYTLKYSMLRERLGENIQLPPDPVYNVPVPRINFQNINKILLYNGISLLLLVLLHIALIGSNTKRRIKWLGLNFFLCSLGLMIISALLFFFVPEAVARIAQGYDFENQKIANAFIKALNAAIDTQKIYYYIEFGLTFVISLVLFALGRLAKEGGPTVIPHEPNIKESLVQAK